MIDELAHSLILLLFFGCMSHHQSSHLDPAIFSWMLQASLASSTPLWSVWMPIAGKNKTWLHIVEMNLMRLDLPLTLCTTAAAHPHISSSKNWNVTQKCQSRILSNFSGLKILSSASPCFSDSSHVCIWQLHILLCFFYYFLLVYCVCVGSSFHCCTFINAFFNLVKISETGFFEKYQKVETQSILHL